MKVLLVSILAAFAQTMPAALPVEALSGKTLSVPADAPTATAVFVVTFEREAKAEASKWTTELRSALPSDQTTIYQVAVLEDVPGFARPLLVSQIRRSVPPPMHDNFLIVSKRSAEWRKAVAVSTNANEAYVLATTQKGEIVWRGRGKFARTQLGELVSALAGHHQ
jgi:hypothetical protein